jgi:hypothetical protein
MLFNRVHDARVAAGPYGAEYASLERQFDEAIVARRQAAERSDRDAFLATDARVLAVRQRATDIVRLTTGDSRYTDVNYVFPTFITTRMPIGLVGLMIAAIFAAAMSASAGELNSLASATIIDFYRRHFVKNATDTHYLNVSKLATIGWGLFACVVAMYAANQGSLIEVVTGTGRSSYGSLLGVFMRRSSLPATAAEAFKDCWRHGGHSAVTFSPWTRDIAFLWHNPLARGRRGRRSLRLRDRLRPASVADSVARGFQPRVWRPLKDRPTKSRNALSALHIDLLHCERSGQVAQVDRLEGAR